MTREKPENYSDLLVWKNGMALVRAIYVITRSFPADEKFGLVSQMRRAAVSIPSNIAEGQARRTTGEFIQAISYAEGSIAELRTQLLISMDLEFCSKKEALPVFGQLSELRKMLNGLRRTLVTRH